MNYVIKVAKTVDEAVSEALKELNISRDEAKIEVIEEASKGFLGLIGTKDATVKVSKINDTKDILAEIFNEESEPEKSQEEAKSFSDELENNSKEVACEVFETEVDENLSVEDICREFIGKLMKSLDIEYDVNIRRDKNELYVEILGDEKELGIVIGKRGVTLDAIQYLLSLIVNKNANEFIRVIVDSSGYRNKREHTLQELAIKMANKTLKTNRAIRLEPMNPQERKIIHEALQDYDGVFTHSEGKDPYRRVVIQKEREY